MGISIWYRYTCMYNLKNIDINEEEAVCLPNKEYISGHRKERINVVVKCIVHLPITVEVNAHWLLVLIWYPYFCVFLTCIQKSAHVPMNIVLINLRLIVSIFLFACTFQSGYYLPDMEVIREDYRVVQPPIQNLRPLGVFVLDGMSQVRHLQARQTQPRGPYW